MEGDTKTEDRILYLLKSKGPQTAGQLAKRLGVTAMAVRQHLYGFGKQGLVAFADQRRPVGRPVRVWRLTERAAARFPESHAELTLEMIAAVRATFGEEGLDRLLAERTRRQLHAYRKRIREASDGSLGSRVRALAAIRREQGYMAESVTRADRSVLLRENHCPICARRNRARVCVARNSGCSAQCSAPGPTSSAPTISSPALRDVPT